MGVPKIRGSTRVSPNLPNRPPRRHQRQTSHCEYPTLEGDSSPRKERPEPKPIIGFKRELSYFQQAQFEEKWTRKSEVMIHSPEPAKPVLHLPQLEANRFNQLQTRHWRQGDHFNQSGDIIHAQEEFYKFIPYTSQHRIKRIFTNSNLPYLEALAFKLQQFFFFSLCTTSEPSKPSRRSQGSSLIPLNRSGSRKIIFFTWSQNPTKGSND
ncbi:hypothetical protein F2Q70_00034913 [Brassica cretica]|uniref:TPX2 central domain-containing protein n=1 Tax=Brassica cretica TaxID=69181 RepID=A0A8S9G874_BRACR|nr:hypothetical protein F2Q68_00029853 [Brassica cretica]KAF2587393.1 hypothetical protein F2Q70_00034913 [Brassica cretica]